MMQCLYKPSSLPTIGERGSSPHAPNHPGDAQTGKGTAAMPDNPTQLPPAQYSFAECSNRGRPAPPPGAACHPQSLATRSPRELPTCVTGLMTCALKPVSWKGFQVVPRHPVPGKGSGSRCVLMTKIKPKSLTIVGPTRLSNKRCGGGGGGIQ